MNLNLCRLCYDRDARINIYQNDIDQLYIKIRYCCWTVNIQENDGLPPSICNCCEGELNISYQFLLRCEAADKKIRSLLFATDSGCANQREKYSPNTEVKSEQDNQDDYPHNADEALLSSVTEINTYEEIKSELGQEQWNFRSSSKNLKQRYRKRINKQELICSVCGRKCLNSSALTIHMRTHTTDKPHKCTSCDKKYKDRGTLKRHVERNHLQKRERKFICENCGKGFFSKSDIQIHMRVHTGETPYTCSICRARFTQMSAMLRHKRRHTDVKSHICSTCSKPFWTKEELKKHYSVHEEARNYSCPMCSVLFKHKGSFQKHMRIHSEPNRFICNHCGKTFNNKGNLKSHMERRHSEKAGHCSICLKNVSNIEMHMWRHTGHRPLKCELCSSSFYELKALAHHVNFKHKKTDKFKCTVQGCNKSFPSNPMLRYHVAKFHEQSPLYSCQRCSRGFYRKNDLARHMLGTHKERLN